MREAHFPKKGYIFQHRTDKELFSRELYLAEGESLDDYKQITEAKYNAMLEASADMGIDEVTE